MSTHRKKLYTVVAFPLLLIIIAAAAYHGQLDIDMNHYTTNGQSDRAIPDHSEIALEFELRDPEQAPEEIREEVMLGHRLMSYTNTLLPQYVGNSLQCGHCHFSCGNTTGGKGGGIPLAGIGHLYPSYNPRSKKVITLEERINGCFMRSMNGLPLPEESKEMKAMVAYIHWISSECPKDFTIPWRGLRRIESTQTASKERGEKLFAQKCAPCHGDEGEGGVRAPPLWGPYSFNSGAGMNDIDIFASFIYHNMPWGNPELTAEEAYDIAAFVTTQPRSKYKHPKK